VFKRAVYIFSNACGVQWRLNKRIFIFLGIFVLIGIVLGVMTAFNTRIKVDHISKNLLDTNLLRVVRPTASFFGIMLGRIFFFALTFVILFVLCLNRWSSFLVFGIATYHGFNMIINFYYIFARFGATGGVLFAVYFLLFPILIFLTMVATVYCLRVCEPIRHGGFRGGICMRDFWRSMMYFFTVVAIFAFIEYIFFWLILSKIVFVV
jgi:hypothetical protein